MVVDPTPRPIPLCHRRLFEADKPFHVVDDVGHADFQRGAGDADGAHHQAHSRFLLGKDMLDMAADFRFAAVGDRCPTRHWPPLRLFPVNTGDKAVGVHELLIGLRAIGSIRPDVAGGIGLVEQSLAQTGPLIGRRISRLPLPDQAEPAVNRDVVLILEGRDRDINRRL